MPCDAVCRDATKWEEERDDRRAWVRGGLCVVEGELGRCDGGVGPWGGRLGRDNGNLTAMLLSFVTQLEGK